MRKAAIVVGLVSLCVILLLGCEEICENDDPTINAMYLSIISSVLIEDELCGEPGMEIWYAADELPEDLEEPVEYMEVITCQPYDMEIVTGLMEVEPDSDIQVEIGETVVISVEASDPDGDALTYAYTLRTEEGETIELEGVGNSVMWKPEVVGGFIINCGVEDDEGNLAEKSFPVKARGKGEREEKETRSCEEYKLRIRTLVTEKGPDKNTYRITARATLKYIGPSGRSSRSVPDATVSVSNITAKSSGGGRTDSKGKVWLGNPNMAENKESGAKSKCIRVKLGYDKSRKEGKGDEVNVTVTIPETKKAAKLQCTWSFRVMLGNWEELK